MAILNKRGHYYDTGSEVCSSQDGDHWEINMSYICPHQGLGAVAALRIDTYSCAVCALHNGTSLGGMWGLTMDTCLIPHQAPWQESASNLEEGALISGKILCLND